MGIGKYIYLGMWTEVREWHAVVLMTLDVKQFDFDWEGWNKLMNCLNNVKVGLQVAEWGDGVIWGVGEIIQYCFAVKRDR